jgi:tRNA-specific 2-thiouridylase
MWKDNGKPKVMVGMSGGVDSSVSAALLQEQGYDVVGAFMKNWSETKDPKTGECAWKEERRDAMRVAVQLGIPFITYDFEKEYDESVVSYLYREYADGRTPNPDVICNRRIKFDLFLKAALKDGADFIATGHYARVQKTGDRFQLMAGLDRNKDQSYFIFSLGQEQLAHVIFPIGHLDKRDVRAYARELGLETAEKKDSQGICFIGKVELGDFLKRGLAPKPGPIVTVEGKEIGRHEDAQSFTIGQRQGIRIGGGDPYFVTAIDIPSAIVTVAQGAAHPALFKKKLTATDWHWVSDKAPNFPVTFQSRIRYRQPLQTCTLVPDTFVPDTKSTGTPTALKVPDTKRADDPTVPKVPDTERAGEIEVRFEVPQRAVSPGQFVVLYEGDVVIGGGVIER